MNGFTTLVNHAGLDSALPMTANGGTYSKDTVYDPVSLPVNLQTAFNGGPIVSGSLNGAGIFQTIVKRRNGGWIWQDFKLISMSIYDTAFVNPTALPIAPNFDSPVYGVVESYAPRGVGFGANGPSLYRVKPFRFKHNLVSGSIDPLLSSIDSDVPISGNVAVRQYECGPGSVGTDNSNMGPWGLTTQTLFDLRGLDQSLLGIWDFMEPKYSNDLAAGTSYVPGNGRITCRTTYEFVIELQNRVAGATYDEDMYFLFLINSWFTQWVWDANNMLSPTSLQRNSVNNTRGGTYIVPMKYFQNGFAGSAANLSFDAATKEYTDVSATGITNPNNFNRIIIERL